jgi:cyclophilin family peptidyl-prolyl cis-trans isomerase
MHLLRSLFLLALLLVPTAIALCADEKTAAPAAKVTPELQDFDKVYGEWKSLLEAAGNAQIKWAKASLTDRPTLQVDVDKRFEDAAVFSAKLQAAAEKAYLADDKNQKMANLLFIMALAHLRNDNYEEALRLADLLIEHKIEAPDLLSQAHRIAASAAFTTMKLDDAKKHIEAVAAGKEIAEESLFNLLGAIEFYKPLWEQEQKLRAAEEKAEEPLPRVKLHTSQGDIVVELFENEAPNTVANFISLVEKGFYDGTQFHRVLPGFVAQGGDPLSKDPVKYGGQIGQGGPTYTIECECVKPEHRKHFRGSLSMAHSGRNTGGSQFFLTFAPTVGLDGNHTVFGRIVEGMDILAKIHRVDPEQGGSLNLDTIIKAEVVRKRNHPYEPKKFSEAMPPAAK